MWAFVGTLIVILNKHKCKNFDEWYDKKYVQKNYFKGNLHAFWLGIEYLQIALFIPISVFTGFPNIGVWFLGLFFK